MTNDPNNIDDPQSNRMRTDDQRSFGGWAIVGLLGLAVALYVVFQLPHRNVNDAADRAPAAPPSATGSGATSATSAPSGVNTSTTPR